jgi:hypothetical protein
MQITSGVSGERWLTHKGTRTNRGVGPLLQRIVLKSDRCRLGKKTIIVEADFFHHREEISN